jgi:hypothetical protein
MSRTKKGSKKPGWDYWGKRPIGLGASGTAAKRTGIQKERAAKKRAVAQEPLEPEYDPREYVATNEEE